ncbi:bifunctional helix-turn-helix transcriptional regulator/GNAT family N-acetyltransferase [Streptomonospora wellingtoniae]|uniref:Helix-turn-helix domain-containing GNAT family N-acetyltransferase n=1 Tax=Streptomonospora wellingtoniae TaxID=3075544 RepID=A0ABU2KYM2_9ACTN|nr:helix-turn-helix domain-containing GNAT family N-acetyltransferase [Streptomonospora sp. DSM 45055]MDT0304411.1 helix-turn-helix domain-containing GNAT family N-acetyltransferase [Streptomonospora sp. DSM 45055]
MDKLETDTGVPIDDVSAIRSFNRFFTRRVGALKPGLLGSPWSLTEVRTMYELRQRTRSEALELRRALDMDAGQLSRVLARLERSGLIVRSPSPEDGRRQVVELTDEGGRAAAVLDDRANEEVVGLISHLSAADRRRLIEAMSTVRRLFEDPAPADSAPASEGLSLREPGPGDLGWVVERHGALYPAQYGWDSSFEAWVARLVADYAQEPGGTGRRLWIAGADDRRAGCIACVPDDESTARLRLFLVEPEARGRGVGSMLMRECLAFARAAGYRRMVLATYSVLGEARRLYQAAGFRLVSSHDERAFGQDLTAQAWELEL